MMHRIAYRPLYGGAESIVANFTVQRERSGSLGGPGEFQAGIRWVELRRDSGTGAVSVAQQGTYAPGAGDGASGRDVWMGSIAQDHQGDIALGFSASVRQSLREPAQSALDDELSLDRLRRAVGRDAAGALAQGEVVLQAGGGSQRRPRRTGGATTPR